MRRPLLLLTLALAVLSGCSSDGDKTATPTTAATTTTTTVASASTTAADDAPRTCSKTLFGGNSGPPPSQGAALGDSRYFGFVSAVDTSGPSITFDVAQLFTGDAATKAAAEDGGESPPDNDYWIRNNSPATRTLTLAADAALCIPADPQDPTSNTKVGLDRFSKYGADGEPHAAWIDVRNGHVTRVEAQFFP